MQQRTRSPSSVASEPCDSLPGSYILLPLVSWTPRLADYERGCKSGGRLWTLWTLAIPKLGSDGRPVQANVEAGMNGLTDS